MSPSSYSHDGGQDDTNKRGETSVDQANWRETQSHQQEVREEESASSSAAILSVGYNDVASFWMRQGILRTLTAPLDRVKYIMECQMEMVRAQQPPASFTSSPPRRGGGGGVSAPPHCSNPSHTPSRALPPHSRFTASNEWKGTSTSGSSSGGGCGGFNPTAPTLGAGSSSYGSSTTRASLIGSSSHHYSQGTASFHHGSALAGGRGGAPHAPPFATSYEAFRHVCRHEGYRVGLFRGNGMQLGSMAAQSVCHYHLSEPIMRATHAVVAPQSASGEVLASYAGFFCSGFLCSFLPYPLEFLRFHLAVDVKGIPRDIGRRGGVPASGSARTASPSASFFPHNYRVPRGLAFLRHHPVLRESPQLCYTGLGLHLLGSVTYFLSHGLLTFGIQMWYTRRVAAALGAQGQEFSPDASLAEEEEGEEAERRQRRDTSSSSSSTGCLPPPPSMLQQVVTDGAVTLLATAIAHPVDVVRRRLMFAVVSLSRPSLRYRSSWACVQQVLREEKGARGLFRGLPISLGRMIAMSTLLQGVGLVEERLLRWRYGV